MSDNFAGILATISANAKRVNDITDQAATVMSKIENAFGAVHVGVEVQEVIGEGDPGAGTILAYGRSCGRFRFIVITTDDGVLTRKPWFECSRDLKLLTFPLVGRLVAKIAAEIDRQAARANLAFDVCTTLEATR